VDSGARVPKLGLKTHGFADFGARFNFYLFLFFFLFFYFQCELMCNKILKSLQIFDFIAEACEEFF
jgi:hypothetical protein